MKTDCNATLELELAFVEEGFVEERFVEVGLWKNDT
jgi:hypothetical protein